MDLKKGRDVVFPHCWRPFIVFLHEKCSITKISGIDPNRRIGDLAPSHGSVGFQTSKSRDSRDVSLAHLKIREFIIVLPA